MNKFQKLAILKNHNDAIARSGITYADLKSNLIGMINIIKKEELFLTYATELGSLLSALNTIDTLYNVTQDQKLENSRAKIIEQVKSLAPQAYEYYRQEWN